MQQFSSFVRRNIDLIIGLSVGGCLILLFKIIVLNCVII